MRRNWSDSSDWLVDVGVVPERYDREFGKMTSGQCFFTDGFNQLRRGFSWNVCRCASKGFIAPIRDASPWKTFWARSTESRLLNRYYSVCPRELIEFCLKEPHGIGTFRYFRHVSLYMELELPDIFCFVLHASQVVSIHFCPDSCKKHLRPKKLTIKMTEISWHFHTALGKTAPALCCSITSRKVFYFCLFWWNIWKAWMNYWVLTCSQGHFSFLMFLQLTSG